MLGGSQAGARLTVAISRPRWPRSLRASAPINSQRGAEAAAGVRYQPFANGRSRSRSSGGTRFRDYGQSAFALFAEGGLYGRPLPWHRTSTAISRAAWSTSTTPTGSSTAQAAVTRPVWRNLSAGLGVWGGAQPGLSRLDVGPRASLRLGRGMRAHVDYRHKLAGNAAPGSGGVVTLAGDF